MTPDDEPFIRAIVDRPGDGLPRLVYADWLDERGDPRGPYLRTELELVANDDVGGLRALRRSLVTTALDPVWAARVSRPPAGVCCDHLRLSGAQEVNQSEAIDAAEEELAITLPAHLRALLLNYNLGRLRGGPFILPREGEARNWPVDAMVCLVDPDFDDETTSYELVDHTVHLHEQDELPEGFVFFAGAFDDNVVVSCRGDDAGAVHYWNAFEQHAEWLANTVGDFLSLLVPKAWPLTDDDFSPAS